MKSTLKYAAKAAKKDLEEALNGMDSYLRFLAESGCRGFDCSTESLQKIEAWGHKNSP